jgi:hypothetical protein
MCDAKRLSIVTHAHQHSPRKLPKAAAMAGPV